MDAVAAALRDLGCTVREMDQETPEGAPKFEDLRIGKPDASPWDAIAEVRGYKKGGANHEDLMRLQRFAKNYRNEMGRDPDAILYIVNGECGRSPDVRSRPLSGTPDMIKAFSELEGVVVSTLDLFRLHRDLVDIGSEKARELLLNARGVFEYAGSQKRTSGERRQNAGSVSAGGIDES